MSSTQKPPIGVTILGILAAVAAGVSAYHALQYLGVIPAVIGRFAFVIQNFVGALLFGFNAALWALVAWGLLSTKVWAWLFAVVIAVMGLGSAILGWLGASDFTAMLPAMLINGIILIYCFTPGVKRAFGRS
jgi:hypothetical protein